jgi:hypothetical protein
MPGPAIPITWSKLFRYICQKPLYINGTKNTTENKKSPETDTQMNMAGEFVIFFEPS